MLAAVLTESKGVRTPPGLTLDLLLTSLLVVTGGVETFCGVVVVGLQAPVARYADAPPRRPLAKTWPVPLPERKVVSITPSEIHHNGRRVYRRL